MTPVLELRNVSGFYALRGGGFGGKASRRVLDRVNIEIAPGEIFGLVGESGCGKTTLGRAILGLIEWEGDMVIGGIPRKRRGGAAQRRAMALKVQGVFQDPAASLNPAKRIGWILEEPLRIHRAGSPRERAKKVDEMLELVGLGSAYRERRPNELSVGQKQRISIGTALMLRPALLVADEPASSLDVSVAAQILNLFQDLHRRLGLALLFISHNLDLVYWLCGKIAVMEQGRIVEQGPAETVYSSPAHPATRRLLEAARYGGMLPSSGLDSAGRCPTLETGNGS